MDKLEEHVMPVLDKLIEKIHPAIESLSDKLGTTAEHLWVILVRQSYNNAIGNMVIIAFAIIGLCLAFKGANIWKKKIDEEGWDKDGWGGIIALKIVSSVVSTIVITGNVTCCMQKLINPEYYALQIILNYIN